MLDEETCRRPDCNAPGDVRLGDYCSVACEVIHLDEIEIDELKAEVQRLRRSIEAHRKTTTLRLAGSSPWATDRKLWEVLDA